MNGDHLEREELEALLRGDSSPETSRRVVRHLLSGCARCAALAEAARQPAAAVAYDAALGRVTARLIARKRGLDEAGALATELMAHPAVEALAQIHSTRRYASLALCELLLRQGRDLWLDGAASDGPGGDRAAELASAVAEQLDPEVYGAQVVPDLRATSWAAMLNAHRLAADRTTADKTLGLAEDLLAARAFGPAGQRGLRSLIAALCFDQGRFVEAAQALNGLATLDRRIGDDHDLARTLLRKAAVWANRGELDTALRLVQRGAQGIEPEQEPRLVVYATHAMVWILAERGEHERAHDLLGQAQALYRERADRASVARGRWLAGRLEQARGRLEVAEEAFTDARVRLAREGLGYEAALAGMDLAFLHARQGRGDRMRRQAEQMMPLFKSQEMYGEAVVALQAYRRHVDVPLPARRPQELLRTIDGFVERMRRRKNTLRLAKGRRRR